MAIEVTARDTESGEEGREVVRDYVLVCAEPYYLDGISRYRNGTTVLTVKRRPRDEPDAGSPS
jgi:hypothetical protein